MKKHLEAVKELLTKNKASVETKLQASITPEQKTKLDETLKGINDAIAALDAAAEQATTEQILAVFSKAVESLSATNDQNMQDMQASIISQMNVLQAKINQGGNRKKSFKASFDYKRWKESKQAEDSYKPFSAGVDVTDWTPEATVEDVEIYHPVIGATGAFTVGSTNTTTVRLRTFKKNSGGVAYVVDHGVKPVIAFLGEENSVAVKTCAGVVEGVADEELEDNPGLVNSIQQEAMQDMAEFENTSAIALLESAGKAFANSNFTGANKPAYADERTAVIAVVDQVRQALGRRNSPIAFVANPSTIAKLKDLRNENGTPIDINTAFAGVEIVEDATLTGDKFYCVAKRFANLKMYVSPKGEWYKGVKVTTTEGNITAVHSEWRTDEQSFRVRQRQIMYISDDTTVVKGNLSAVVTALKA